MVLLMILFTFLLTILFISQTPLMFCVSIVISIFLISFWVFFFLKESIIPCILILVILGGMMILFMFMSVLVESFIMVNFMKIMGVMFFLCMLIIMFLSMSFMSGFNMLFSSNMMINLIFMILPFLFLVIYIISSPFNSVQYFS